MAYLSNPWIWLLTAIFAYYLIKRLNLNTKYYDWQQKREYLAEAEHVKKNPDFYRQRMEAMERARQKQQVNIFAFGDHISILIIVRINMYRVFQYKFQRISHMLVRVCTKKSFLCLNIILVQIW